MQVVEPESVRRQRLRVVAGAQGGVFSAADAFSVGISRGRLRTLIQCGAWVRLQRGALAERSIVDWCGRDPRSAHTLSVAAALLALRAPAAAVKASAACLWQLDFLGEVPSLPLLVRPAAPHAGGRTEANLRILRAGRAGWRVTDVSGVCSADLARTGVDLARTWPFADALVAVDSALRLYGERHLHQMRGAAAQCETWPGGGCRVLSVLDAADPRSESVLETVGRLAMRRDGLPPPRTQCWIGDLGPEIRTDYGREAQRTVGEADGRVKYTDSNVLWKQARREERIHDLGFEVVRFDLDGTRRPGGLGGRFRGGFARSRPGRGRFWPDPPWWTPGVPPASPPGVAWWLWDVDDLPSRWDD